MENGETTTMTQFPSNTLPITVEFTGGLEMLFSNQRKHHLSIPAVDTENRKAANIAFLVGLLCQDVMKGKRKEMFVLDGTVRPGILVLINDADWELEGEEKYELQKGDNILFVSTLHGG
ncbi:Ubiquitin- modifier 1 [Schaereria dolodes]|nr:Ubiquitin- modifier 1 [Schaereria dolodes]